MFSASSTVLVATVLTLVTTASLTALACSLVFSATARGLWLAVVLIPPCPGPGCPSQAEQPLSRGTQRGGPPLLEALDSPSADSRESLMLSGEREQEAHPGFNLVYTYGLGFQLGGRRTLGLSLLDQFVVPRAPNPPCPLVLGSLPEVTLCTTFSLVLAPGEETEASAHSSWCGERGGQGKYTQSR